MGIVLSNISVIIRASFFNTLTMTMSVKHKHLLLIDDDKDEATIFDDALSMIPYEHAISCTYAFSADQALEILEYIQPDFIFLDLNMPTMSGFDLLFKIRNEKKLGDVKIYLHSTSISDSIYQAARLVGVSGCIKKTNSIQELADELTAVLNAPSKSAGSESPREGAQGTGRRQEGH